VRNHTACSVITLMHINEDHGTASIRTVGIAAEASDKYEQLGMYSWWSFKHYMATVYG